jgi:predicted phage terminase large subunit-like protein
MWMHISIPLEAEKDETWRFPNSGRVVWRKKGEILMPERFTPAVVEDYRSRRQDWAAQYQQRPTPIDGGEVRLSDIRYYGGIDPRTGQPDEKLPANFDMKIISVDCAFKNLPTSDYVAIGVIGVKYPKKYFLNVINAHLDAAATEAEIRRQRLAYAPINAILVEDKANGPAIIQRLKVNVPGVIARNPQGGKIPRMRAAACGWQAGEWFIDRDAAWTPPFVEQIIMFPNAAYDDMVDMMSQAAAYLLDVSQPVVRSSNAFTGELHWSSDASF